MSRRLGPEGGILSLKDNSKPTCGGSQDGGDALHTGLRCPVTHQEYWMHNGWAVHSVGPSGPQKSKKVFTRVLLK